MNILEAERRAQAWLNAADRELFVLAFEDEDLFYTESPEEQGLTPEQPQEYLVRVFMTRGEAGRYHDAIREFYPQMKFIVRSFIDFEAMWPTLMSTNETFQSTLQMPVRAVLSTMPIESWPRTQDTVFSVAQMRN